MPPPSSTGGTATIRVLSRLTVIDVVVTDKKGPIKGLKKRDFSIMENGLPQTLVSMDEHTGTAPSDVPSPPKLPPGVYSNVPIAPPTDKLTVVLIDGLNTSFTDQPYVKMQMLKYLKGMPAGTRVAIFTLGSRLRFLQGFTDDPSQLAEALKKKNTGYLSTRLEGGTTEIEQVDPTSNAEMALSIDSALSSLQGFENDLAHQHDIQRHEMTVEAFQEIADYLSNFPGRKNLIWFADQFPLTVGSEFTPDLSFDDIGTGPDQTRATTNMLTSAQISVYPVDASGLKPPAVFSASQRGVPNVGSSLSSDFGSDAAKHVQMNQLAEDTGGKAMYNTNDLGGAVAKIVNSATYYYTLSFVPPTGLVDGKFRKIKVTVPGKSYTLSYRKGYFSKSPDLPPGVQYAVDPNSNPDQANPFYRTMRRGAPATTQILFKIRAVPIEPQPDTSRIGERMGDEAANLTGPVVRYRIDWAIDMHSVSTTVGDDGLRSGTVKFSAVGFDADGKSLNSSTQALDIKFTPADFSYHMLHGLAYRQELDLPKGEVFLRLGVYDPDANKVGSTEVPLLVRPRAAAPATSATMGAKPRTP